MKINLFGNNELHSKECYHKTFENLLYDSVYQLYFAHDINVDNYNDDVVGCQIRSSIFNSILLLECGANCLLDSIDLSSSYLTDIDKMPFISKYEFFFNQTLAISSDVKFDRGCKEIQAINELKSLRDKIVHPKVKKLEWKKIDERIWDVEHGTTNILKISFNSSLWTQCDAIKSLKAVNDFFNKYFLEWCKFDTNLVVDLLLSDEKVNFENPLGGAIDTIGGLDRAVKEWQIDFKFIGKTLIG